MNGFRAVVLCGLLAAVAFAQRTRAVDDGRRVTLAGHVHPLANARNDRGAAPQGMAVDRILLALQRSPEQERQLQQLLEKLQDPASPEYQHWLTPEEFGFRFGISDADLDAVEAWLTAQGFRVDRVTKGRTLIEFSGTAATIERAFRTPIHKYVVNGTEHWANAAEPQIPEALAPVLAGLVSLHDFHSTPQLVAGPLTDLGNGSHALSPADYAVLYNLKPVYLSGIDGTGATIGIVGRTNINLQDVVDFRSTFQLRANNPQIVINGVDPGVIDSDEEMEAVLDTSWSGAVAPGARVKLVVSKSTVSTDGIFLSEEYIVDNNLADVMSISFGSCEAANLGTAAGISALAQQAAAQGISVVVSSGDSGAAGCDGGSSNRATGPISVNVLSSPVYVTAVGGTQFDDTSAPSQYWRSTNGAGLASALSRIPETVWNESCAAGQPGCATPSLWSGGGGASVIFAKPAWQTGVAGIPADGARDVPDVSLTASIHDAYLVCMLGSCHAGAGGFYTVGGTSASAPSFAGMLALVKQKMNARLGVANPKLYTLAAKQASLACDGSATSSNPNAGCIYYDTTAGNNAVPGEAGYGTPGASYAAGAGYDLTTGLGSVNANNLVNQWANATLAATTTAMTVNPPTFGAGGTTTVSVTVAPNGGPGVPTGTVALLNGSGQTVDTLTLSNGSAVVNEAKFPSGTYSAVARYSGDTTYAGSSSAGTALTVIAPTMSANPASSDFGSIALGSSSTSQALTIANTGSVAATAVAVRISGTNPGDFRQTNTCGATLAVGASCTVTITFTPAGAGARAAQATVAAFGMTTLAAPLTGVGLGSGRAQLSRTVALFNNTSVGAASSTVAVTLSSTGSAAVNAIAIGVTGANAGDFAQSNNCGSSLAPGASCTINVTFGPTATGSRVGTLSVASSATSAPLAVSLAGIGLAAIPAPSIASVTGTIVHGTSSTVTVNGSNFQTGLSAAIATPFGNVTVASSAITVVNASQVKLQVVPPGQSGYTATLTMLNAGNAQAATARFAVK